MKNSSRKECFCAHCRSKRVLKYSRRLEGRHFIQIFVLTLGVTAVLYPYFDWKGACAFFLIWPAFDMTDKTLARRDLKCPYCGFDPTWYKKDVTSARRQVEDFLKQNPESPVLRRRTQENPITFN